MTVSLPLPVMLKDKHGEKASLQHASTMQSLLLMQNLTSDYAFKKEHMLDHAESNDYSLNAHLQ